MKQSPIRRIRRDRSRLLQELSLARGTGDLAKAAELEKNIAGFKRLARFAPFVAGDTFTQADCAAFANLPVVGMATKAIYGEDLLVAGGVDYKPYIKLIGERPSAQKVVADRKAATTKA